MNNKTGQVFINKQYDSGGKEKEELKLCFTASTMIISQVWFTQEV